MKQLCLLSLIAFNISANDASEQIIYFDNVLDGQNTEQMQSRVNLKQSGSILFGTSSDGGPLTGHIEASNNLFYGSGNTRRVQFNLVENGIQKWFMGTESSEGNWHGVWFGPNQDKGDFSVYLEGAPSSDVPTYNDILEFSADPIFSGGSYDRANPLNEGFLVDEHGLEPFPFAQLDQSRGLYVQSDTGGTPFPMSFYLTFKRPFELKTFRLGSFNNRYGTRLSTFNFDIWEDGQWVTKGEFYFEQIPTTRTWQRQEFSLPTAVTATKIRISATGTNESPAVLMFGLSFQ
ncbi:hypothetical protein ACSLBF_12010 [Pseudoalteromonas sp. T1lg65]|uniref:hypothetical protein n=1 Tax=Pseudoalteromonas sp. T1lg65 TaxID=2077101 RepID=UPI003F79658A